MKQLIMGEIEKERDQAGKDAGHFEKPRPTDPGPEAKKSRFADIEDSDTEENSTEIGLASSSDLAIAEMNKYLDAKLTELNIDSFLISGKIFGKIHLNLFLTNILIFLYSFSFLRN